MLFCVTLPILFSLMEYNAELLQVIGPDTPLIAVAGEDLVLPCFIKPQTSAVDMTVEWYRPDSENSLVHLYKDHEDTNEKQAQTYRGRTSLFKAELQKGNTSLKLSSLRVSDEGDYKCLVADKSKSNETTVHVIVEVQGSHPVITMESYDNSGGIHLVCDSRGWKPEPEVLWLDRKGATLPAEVTQIHRHNELSSVKSRITVYDYSDSNRFYCELRQKHYMMETEIVINSPFFAMGMWIVGILVSACLFAVILILMSVLLYIKDIKRLKQKAGKQIVVMENGFINRNKFAVDVTLDPDTAHPELILSANGKQVELGDELRDVPDTPKRFKYHSVLGKPGFGSGRFYYEVQVGNKTEWTLGIVGENINRKRWVDRKPKNFFWTITFRNNAEYWANADHSDRLTLREKVEKVGVFVDYEVGLVSFYDVNSSSHIYSFTDQTFTEKLYPYFSPRYNERGENAEPMIITDVPK